MTTVLDTTGVIARKTQPGELQRPKAVSVNGVAIPMAEIAREAQNHPATKAAEAWHEAARALVVRELLLQEAKRLGLAAEPAVDEQGRTETDEEALVRILVAREVAAQTADEATCRRYFEKNRQKFQSSPLFAVRHILCAAAPGDAGGREAAHRLAEQIIAELQRDPSQFDALAAAHSACPSRNMAGNLGQISRGQTVPEFERSLEGLPVGSVAAEAIETRFGFHVVIVDKRIDGEALPFGIVHERIAEWLDESARRTAIRQYIAALAGRAEIAGVDFDTASGPLAG